jgi:hypothetical protein
VELVEIRPVFLFGMVQTVKILASAASLPLVVVVVAITV